MATEIADPHKPAATPNPPTPAPTTLRERLGIKKRAAKAPEEPPVIPPKTPPAAAPPASKKKPATPPAPVIDVAALGTAIADGLNKAKPAEKPAPAAPKEPELSPVNKRRFQVLEQMAKDSPEAKELPQKFLAAIKNEAQYRKEWEESHKGEKFDPEDEDHKAFFAGNDVEWDEDAYEMAREQIIKAEATAEAQAKMKPKFDEMDAKERAQAAIPLILTHQAATAKLLFDGLGKDFEKVLKPGGEIDHAEIGRMIEGNPIMSQVFPIAEHTEKVAGEIYRIANELSEFNPKNPLHVEIFGFVNGQEAAMKKLPPDEQKNPEGKQFATAEEWSKMNAEQRAKHWHFTEEHLSAIYAAQSAAKAKKIITNEEEKFKLLSEKRGYSKSGEKNPPPATPPKNEETPASTTNPPPSPPGAIAPRMAAVKKNENNGHIPLSQRLRGVR